MDDGQNTYEPKEPFYKKIDKPKLILGIAGVLLLIIAVLAVILIVTNKKEPVSPPSRFATNAVEKGRYLSDDKCTGEGTHTLTNTPLKIEDIGAIVPYGSAKDQQVVPHEFQYYYQKDVTGPRNTFNVYAPADGVITKVAQHTTDKNEIRWDITISHSCTFFTHLSELNSLTSELQAALNQNADLNYTVKSGEVIGYIGNQALEFAVWDTSKTLTGLASLNNYNNAAPWLVHTTEPLFYYTDNIKNVISLLYMGSSNPVDGRVDYDQLGTLAGNWFKTGSEGLASQNKDHLSLGYDNLDQKTLIVSSGNFWENPEQFMVMGNKPDWATIKPSDKVVKYELTERIYLDKNKQVWDEATFAEGIKATNGKKVGTMLVQLTDDLNLKVEFFTDKKPAQVKAFTENAQLFNRAQDIQPID